MPARCPHHRVGQWRPAVAPGQTRQPDRWGGSQVSGRGGARAQTSVRLPLRLVHADGAAGR